MKNLSDIRVFLFAGVAVFSAWPGTAPATDVAEGRALAEAHCTRCHGVNAEDDSPNPSAPALASFKAKWPLSHLEEALAEGIVTGHDNDMPVFTFSPDEIDDLLGFFASLP